MKYKIALFQGDGVGPELIAEGMKVIEKASELDKFGIEWIDYPHGAEHYNETKELPGEKLLKDIKASCNAIYCGTFDKINGDSKANIPNLIKDYFEQSISLRPIRLLPSVDSPLVGKTSEDIDFVIIRENSEDFYVGAAGRAKSGKNKNQLSINNSTLKIRLGMDIESKGSEIAYQLGVISKKGCERIIKYAFEYAKGNDIKKITSVDKANLLEFYNFWRECLEKVAKDYHDIQYECNLANSAIMGLIRQPEKYKMIVAPNLIGDILSELGTMLQGGIAFGARGNINPEGLSMFEPIHGSASKLKGQGIISPIATIWAGALMLENIGQRKSGELIMKAIAAVLKEGKTRTQELDGSNTTSEMGDAIADKFVEMHE